MLKLKIKNFRCFENTTFDFSKVNILIGENSSGKSSLLKLLLMLRNSTRGFSDNVLQYKSDSYNLGKFKTLIFDNDLNRDLSFEISISPIEYEAYYYNFMSEKNNKKNKYLDKVLCEFVNNTLSLEFIISYEKSFESVYQEIKIGDYSVIIKRNENRNNKSVFSFRSCDITFNLGKLNKTFKNVDCEYYGFLTIINGISLDKIIRDEFTQEDTVKFLYYEIAYFLVCQNYISDYLKKISYMNPLGSQPCRRIDLDNATEKNDLSNFVAFLCKNKKVQADYNGFLKEYKIISGFKIKHNKEMAIAELLIKDNGRYCNIVDVGYGISLILPILFKAYYSAKGFLVNTILLEQPEIHLHPKLQCDLIAAFISTLKKHQIIIETHSPFIVQKLQTMVKKREFGLKSSDVKIYYFKKNMSDVIITEHVIDEDGMLSPFFPKGFYDVSYELTRELL